MNAELNLNKKKKKKLFFVEILPHELLINLTEVKYTANELCLSPKKTSIKVIVVAACFCFGGKRQCSVSKAEQSSDGGGGQWRPS